MRRDGRFLREQKSQLVGSVEQAAAVIEDHMRSDHPELVGKVTREDVIAMAEEA